MKPKPLKLLQPMAHQRISLDHSAKSPIVYDTSDAGTGKTAVRIWSFAARRRKNGKCALVIAPKNLLRNTWANDYKKFAPDMKVLVSTAGKHDDVFAQDADVYVTNHDAVKWLAKQKKAFFDRFDTLDVDEPTAYKHKDSQRSRAMAKIVKHFTYRAGMTATPNSNGICDVWHQIYLLDGGERLGKSFYAFRNSVCEPKQVGRQANMVEWVDKEGAEEAVFGLLQDIVVRHKLDDCADIPQTHFHTVTYTMPATQRKAYDQLELTALLPFKGAKAPTLTAVNAAAVTTKLLQVCSGAVYDNDGDAHLLTTGRYDLVLDLVEAREHSLVYFNWKHQKDMLVAAAEARGLPYCVLDGSTPDSLRAEMVTAYQAGKYRVMFAHPRSAAHGLTLTKGTATIWTGPIYDLELVEQGNKRQRRLGQTKKTEVITVIAEDTIEEKVYALLQSKDARMKSLLDLFGTIVKDRA